MTDNSFASKTSLLGKLERAIRSSELKSLPSRTAERISTESIRPIGKLHKR